MLIIPTNIYRSLAVGAILVATLAVLAALTLLPAALSLLGDRVNALRLPFLRGDRGENGGFWARVATFVMAHRVVAVIAVLALLISAASVYFSINSGLPGVSGLPEDTKSRQAFEVLDNEFSAGLISPTEIVIDAPDVNTIQIQAATNELIGSLDADPMFTGARVETNEAGDLAVLSTLIEGDANADAAYDAVDRLRNQYIPAAFRGVDAEVLVSGDTAQADDLFSLIADYTPIVFGFVLALSFLLLLVVFRSIVVPVKALVMNLLSVGATYGLVVLVFQHGVGNEVFGFQRTETIAAWLPLFLFAILFGLSMDYHVFLLSRIRERYDITGDNTDAVAYGLRTTGRLITGAALIMVAVFGGFAMGDLVMLQQVGFGLGVAVLIDATIIRSILVPSSMKLLGKWNWYLPPVLSWLPRIGIEGQHGAAAPEGAGGGS
jgi:RND superfamily putative drug exporter